MKVWHILGLAGACCAAPAFAATEAQPPMNDFNSAFYTCDNGRAFSISYDSDKPTEATVTTNNNQKEYKLKRAQGAAVQFSDGQVKISAEGQRMIVEGMDLPYANCRIRPG